MIRWIDCDLNEDERSLARPVHNSPTTTDAPKQFDFSKATGTPPAAFPSPIDPGGEGPDRLKATKLLDGCVAMKFFEGLYEGTIISGSRRESTDVSRDTSPSGT